MYYCPNCNFQSENPMNFCTNCGNAMVEAAPVQPTIPEPTYTAPEQTYAAPQQPLYTQYTNNPPVQPTAYYPTNTPPAAPSKAKAITGMALAASGLMFAVLGFFYVIMFMAIDGAAGFGMSIGFGIFSFPLSLIGLIMSGKARSAGDQTAFSKIGKILGLIGTILSGLNILLGIMALATYDPYYYY